MNLPPTAVRPAPVHPSPALPPDAFDRVEDEVARTADLVLKSHRLLERAEGRDAQPDRAARMARLAWVLEHGQVALRRAAGDGVPGPRLRS